MLEGVKSALMGAKGVSSQGSGVVEGKEGYKGWSEEEKGVGLRALGRVYAGWGFSQAFYRERQHEKYLGFKDLEDFMVNFWEAWACSKGRWNGCDYVKSPKYRELTRGQIRRIC